MKKVLQNFIAFTLIISAISVNAQQIRYLDNVFSNVTVTTDIQYAENISVLPTVLSGGVNPPALTPIMCDIYEPTGDSLNDRPVVILAHTGSFLPQVINGQPTGDKTDSSVVHQCMRWARKGYVAVAMNNRLGWNPTSPDQDTRTGTLLQAAYRGIQDAKAMVRFLRKTEDLDGNPYGIDPNKIALGGQGTGGYLSLGYATLDTTAELFITKFFNLNTMLPYVIPGVMGNIDGTDSAGIPIPDSITGQVIDTSWMNIPNWPSYSNDINMVFNIGGCLADSSWLEQGDVPMVSFHCTNDPYGPYANGIVIVPTNGNYVVEVQGSYIVQKHQAMYGNNAVFTNAGFSDAFTNAANANNAGYGGLYPFLTPTPSSSQNAFGESYEEEGAPWDWWDNTWYDNMHQAIHGSPAGYGPANSILGNPNMSSTYGNAYLDTIQGYLNPRMFLALGLDTLMTTSIEDIINFSTEIYPNPTTEKVNVVSYAAAINTIEIYNINGQIVYSKQVNANAIKINITSFSSGTYLMNIKSEKTTVSRKLIIE
ncbi:MAG: T9SS type A sorting domain-containing protein [Bacteroidota bacterium]|nr:T9SS type A sorting domain-containing protein [Bacteroidota bacterium]